MVVISGREVENLRAKVGVEGLTYAGNHGLHVMHADGQMYQHTIPQVNFIFFLIYRAMWWHSSEIRDLCLMK